MSSWERFLQETNRFSCPQQDRASTEDYQVRYISEAQTLTSVSFWPVGSNSLPLSGPITTAVAELVFSPAWTGLGLTGFQDGDGGRELPGLCLGLHSAPSSKDFLGMSHSGPCFPTCRSYPLLEQQCMPGLF